MISFPLRYEHFTCEPFSSLDHRTALFRFEALELIDSDGNSYIPKGLQKSINEDVAEMDNESFNEILPAIELVYLAVDKMDFEELPEDLEKSVVNNLVTEYTEQCKFLYQAIDIM